MVHALLIVAFLAVMLRDDLGRSLTTSAVTPDRAYLTMLAGMAAVWLLAHARIALLGRSLDRTGSFRAIFRAERTLAASRLAATALHVIAVWLGSLAAVRSHTRDLIVLDELLTLAPLLLFFIGGWWSIYPVERRVREALLMRRLDDGRPFHPTPTRAAFVLYATRHQLALVAVPIFLILAWHESAAWLSRHYRWPRGYWQTSSGLLRKRDVILPLIQGAGVLVVLAILPVILRRIWDTVRLGAGETRDTLLAVCRAHRVRVRELLVWRTGGQVLNGAVMGIIAPARYILLTDALLETMTPGQVEAVIAHEVGHVRRRHMIWRAVAAVGGVMGAAVLLDMLLRLQPGFSHEPWLQPAATALSLATGLVIFGYVSRRFEWQADAFAVQHLSGLRRRESITITPESVAHMTSALQLVAELNHVPVRKWTWLHGSILTRQKRLATLVGRPAARLPIDRYAAAVKLTVAALLAASLAAAAYDFLR